MKTFLKSIFKFLQSIFLQFLLSIVALFSWINCQEIGNQYEGGSYLKKIYKEDSYDYEPVGTSIDAGFNGGSLAMGIICAVCIIMIVWLEINKKSKS